MLDDNKIIKNSNRNFTKISIASINCNIFSLIFFANAFQIGLSTFGLEMNIVVEYILLLAMLFINKFRIKNLENSIVLYGVGILFLANYFLFNNFVFGFYLKEFILVALPLILVFLFRINYKMLTKIFKNYAIIGTILYFYILVTKTEVFSQDYMTYGYHAITFASYLFIYFFYKRKILFSLISLIIMIIFGIYGPRGVFLEIIAIFAIIASFKIKNSWGLKISLIMLSVVFINYGIDILRNLFEILINDFNLTNYSIMQFRDMLDSSTIENLVGSRYVIFEQAINIVLNSPILGLGIAGFHSQIGTYPHDIFLDVITTFGALFGTLYFFFIYRIIKKFFRFSNLFEIKVFFVFCLANASRLLFSHTFIYDPTIWLLIAMGLNVASLYKKKENVNYDNNIDSDL